MTLTNDDGVGRLSVSEERIQRLFAEFEGRLLVQLQRYATNEAVRALEKVVDAIKDRVHSLELANAEKKGEDANQARFSGRALAWAALASAAFGSVVAVIGAIATIYWLHHG